MEDATTPKRRRPGRPRLPKSQAKGRIVPIRFSPETMKTIEAMAKMGNQTVSQWIRGTVEGAIRLSGMDTSIRK